MTDQRRKVTPIHPGLVEAIVASSIHPELNIEGDPDLNLSNVEIKRADMNKVFEATMEILDQVDDPQELFDAILEEYSRRLDQFPGASILPRAGHEMTPEEKQQLSLLILFSSQAVLLKEKAHLFTQLRNRNQEIRTSSKLLTEALKDTEEARNLLQATLENLSAGVVVLDLEGTRLFSNTLADRLLREAPALFPPANQYRRFLENGVENNRVEAVTLFDAEIEVEGNGFRTIHRKLSHVPAMPDRKPLMILQLEDVTEERKLRDDVLRSGRLTAVLDTWAALNHEINNPLAAILGRAQILLVKPNGLNEKTIAGLKVIEESALRIVELTARLKELTSPTFTEYTRGVTMLDIHASTRQEQKKAG